MPSVTCFDDRCRSSLFLHFPAIPPFPSETSGAMWRYVCWQQLMLKLGLSNFDFHDFLAQFSGAAEEKLKHATATFCSNQPFALEVIKSRQKKDSRFQTFVQVNFMQGFELLAWDSEGL